MALNTLQLSLMTFPQRWDGKAGTLTLNLLLLPVGDPTAPLGTGPAFAGTTAALTVKLVTGLDMLPTTTTAPALTQPFVAVPPPVAPALFDHLRNQLVAQGVIVTSDKVPDAPKNRPVMVNKALPESYKQAFAYEKSTVDGIVDGDGFGCALRAQAPGIVTSPTPPKKEIAWGQVLSYAMRQPVLARTLGLIYPITLALDPVLLAAGGYVWVDLDASNPWFSASEKADKVRAYAARVPALGATAQRGVFAARLFPIAGTADPKLTDAQQEADAYDDGFAQIVHAHQPTSIDTASLDTTQIAPGAEPGIQLGWDDEQVTGWLNGQIRLLHDRVNDTQIGVESPLGVLGYRVDVREKDSMSWRSLCAVDGSLPFDDVAIGKGASTSISGNEFWLSPAPVRAAVASGSNDTPAWLPLYFAQWRGRSLVLPDPVVQLLAVATAVKNPPQPLPAPSLPNPNANLSGVPTLRYGHEYEFRVRLADLTGGGPSAHDPMQHPGPAPISPVRLLRHLPPKALEVTVDPAPPPFPAKPAPVRALTHLTVRRPRIGYPEAVFAGVPPSTFMRPSLDALIQGAWASGRAIAVADPDVDRFEVRVEARLPAHDTGDEGTAPGDVDGAFRVVYTLEVPFPAGADPAVTLTLDYVDGIDDIAAMSAPADGTTRLPIPSARDVRVRLFPKAAARPNYYGSDTARIGLPSDYTVRKEAAQEDALFPTAPALQLQTFYFQPGANMVALLAQQLNLRADGLRLAGPAGERVVFGGSGQIRHATAGDGSTFAFANPAELLGQWIVALVLDVERDWTWDGFAASGAPPLRFDRDGVNVGNVTWARVVAASAASPTTSTALPDRTHTRVVFFDAYNPQPTAPAFPREGLLHYAVTASFAAAPAQQLPLSIRLPITTPPAQTPKIVATGIAESPYLYAPDYSATSPRDRYLWIEFDQPLRDTDDDAYFGRVLAYGPDPLLALSLLPPLPDRPGPVVPLRPDGTDPDLAIDPEPVRRVFAGQSADQSGLDAMTPLIPAESVGPGKSGRFFLLPLPPNVDPGDPVLFGFWTYEFRVGHAKMWSTAQGRYGRPLRVSGLQHPAPQLACSVQRAPEGIGATAPYAIAVDNGNRLFDFGHGDPQTQIWFMLYVQVLQADGASYRNVLLAHRRGAPRREFTGNPQHGSTLAPMAVGGFAEGDIEARLARLALPKTAPLSVLAVEVLPGLLNGGRGVALEAADTMSVREDPMQAGLGTRRILRTSPLAAVPPSC